MAPGEDAKDDDDKDSDSDFADDDGYLNSIRDQRIAKMKEEFA